MTGKDLTTAGLRAPKPALQNPDAMPNASAVWDQALDARWSGPPEHRPLDAPLPAIDTLTAAARELAEGQAGQGGGSAAKQAEILIGSYPAREVTDAAIFVRAVTSVLAEVPADVGKEAVDRLTRRLKFLPTRADVAEEITGLMATRASVRNEIAAMIDEHERRAKGRPASRPIKDMAPDEREAFFASQRQKHGLRSFGDSVSKVLDGMKPEAAE